MSILELKQQLSRLSQRERRELQIYLARLKHETPASKRTIARTIRRMKRGEGTSIQELEARYRRG